MRLMIFPWEYRHLRAFGRVRALGGVVLGALGVVTLAFGGNDFKTYAWASVFLALAAVSLVVAWWELGIARSEAPR
jgi:hypothetical protein